MVAPRARITGGRKLNRLDTILLNCQQSPNFPSTQARCMIADESLTHERNAVVRIATILGIVLLVAAAPARAADPWVIYEGADGPGKGKHIVLVSGDEEYRSEEALPQLGKILAKHHGFKCTVLFAVDPQDGTINPNMKSNIPGLEALKTADLLIIFTRMRDLPDDQMQHLASYIESGRPVIGLRTATHAFDIKQGKKY